MLETLGKKVKGITRHGPIKRRSHQEDGKYALTADVRSNTLEDHQVALLTMFVVVPGNQVMVPRLTVSEVPFLLPWQRHRFAKNLIARSGVHLVAITTEKNKVSLIIK